MDFERSQTQSLVSRPKSTKNHESNATILNHSENPQADTQDSKILQDSQATQKPTQSGSIFEIESGLLSEQAQHEAENENLNAHKGEVAVSRFNHELKRNEIKSHEVPPLKALSGVSGISANDFKGEGATSQFKPLPLIKKKIISPILAEIFRLRLNMTKEI